MMYKGHYIDDNIYIIIKEELKRLIHTQWSVKVRFVLLKRI